MGVYACLWVRWGVGGTGNTKTRQRGGDYGLADPDLGSMVGEISPNIMFLKTKSKMGANDCRWVRMGSHGCNRVY